MITTLPASSAELFGPSFQTMPNVNVGGCPPSSPELTFETPPSRAASAANVRACVAMGASMPWLTCLFASSGWWPSMRSTSMVKSSGDWRQVIKNLQNA